MLNNIAPNKFFFESDERLEFLNAQIAAWTEWKRKTYGSYYPGDDSDFLDRHNVPCAQNKIDELHSVRSELIVSKNRTLKEIENLQLQLDRINEELLSINNEICFQHKKPDEAVLTRQIEKTP